MQKINEHLDVKFEKPESIFNDLFYKILLNNNSRYLINYGGSGSSKSFSQAQAEIFYMLKRKQNSLVIRKYATTLKDSCWALMIDIINRWNIRRLFRFNLSEKNIYCCNGSSMIFRGLDDPEKIKSIHGIKRIWIEEASELAQDDITQLNLRLRGDEDLQASFTFNPISIEHPIKNYFFDTEEIKNKCSFLHTNYKDNRFIDKAYIDELESLKFYNPNYYKVYALGEWGNIKTGNEFYFNFVYEKHVDDITYNKDLPLHISFDFNVIPYITATIWQIDKKDGIYYVNCIDELCLAHPNNNTVDLCEKILYQYKKNDFVMQIYGDATGKARSTQSKEHNYDIIKRILTNKLNNYSINVPASNPSVPKRRDFMNYMLSDKYNVRMKINRTCKNTIADFTHVNADVDGTKLKRKVKDEKIEMSYERYGHCSDSVDYLFCEVFKNIFYSDRFIFT